MTPVKPDTAQVVADCTTGIIDHMPSCPPGASVIVPTFHEASNIQQLIERVFAAIAPTGREAELIVVDDDSQDGTAEVVEALRTRYPIRLMIRHGERGLSGAVLTGFRRARFDRFVVLDADLQHPPEMIPTLLERLDEGDHDFAIATRYAPESGIAEHWSPWRRFVSRVATLLARPLAPLSDPMSGFFALRRDTWERAAPLSPIGYKIALELYTKARCRRPAEVPIHFAARSAGDSKLTLAEHVRFLRHLVRLYRFRFPRWTTAAGATALLIVLGSVIVLIT